jgi:hypothetical protein
VDRDVAGEKGQAVGQLEDPLVQGSTVPQSGAAQRCLMNQLQRQAWAHTLGGLFGPAAHQVPSPQAEQLGDEEPDTSQVTREFVGEKLSDSVLDAARIAWDRFGALSAGSNFDDLLRAWAVAIEFFFEGRTPR